MVLNILDLERGVMVAGQAKETAIAYARGPTPWAQPRTPWDVMQRRCLAMARSARDAEPGRMVVEVLARHAERLVVAVVDGGGASMGLVLATAGLGMVNELERKGGKS